MPVHMILVMDQNRLPRLLVECANSKMPIEVRKVRISSAAGTGSSSKRPSGMGAPFGGGMRGAPPPVAGMAAADAESSQDDILVEIHAVIYIFNPPDREKLGKGAAAAAAPPGSPAKVARHATAARHAAHRFTGQAACRPAGQGPCRFAGQSPCRPPRPRQNPGEMRTMKVKLKFDAKSIQALLIANVEKIGFAVVAVICLLMVYYAVAGMKGDPRTPDQLVQAIHNGERAIDTTSFKPDLKAADDCSRRRNRAGYLSRSPLT